jgi:2-dehydropantoate 2-reductase
VPPKPSARRCRRVLAWAGSLAPEARASLAHDLAAGKRIELEALHGHAVRLGERLGVPVPSVFAVYAALKPHVAGRPD